MAKNNAVDLDITNNADGYDISGGTTTRKLTVTGADITLTGSGTNTYTFPSATDTLVGRASTDTLTNKTIDANGTGNSITNLEVADFAASALSGSDSTVVTGTSGTNGNILQWNADGDAVDASIAAADVVTSTSTDTFTNKTFDANGTGNSLSNVEVADIATAAKAGGGSVLATEFSKSITVESPTATEDISVFFTNDAITVTEMRAVVRGTTPSVTWTIRHGTDRSAAGAEVVTSGTTTTSESTGSDVTSFNDATIVADSFVWLETTAATGTNDELHITIFFTID